MSRLKCERALERARVYHAQQRGSDIEMLQRTLHVDPSNRQYDVLCRLGSRLKNAGVVPSMHPAVSSNANRRRHAPNNAIAAIGTGNTNSNDVNTSNSISISISSNDNIKINNSNVNSNSSSNGNNANNNNNNNDNRTDGDGFNDTLDQYRFALRVTPQVANSMVRDTRELAHYASLNGTEAVKQLLLNDAAGNAAVGSHAMTRYQRRWAHVCPWRGVTDLVPGTLHYMLCKMKALPWKAPSDASSLEPREAQTLLLRYTGQGAATAVLPGVLVREWWTASPSPGSDSALFVVRARGETTHSIVRGDTENGTGDCLAFRDTAGSLARVPRDQIEEMRMLRSFLAIEIKSLDPSNPRRAWAFAANDLAGGFPGREHVPADALSDRFGERRGEPIVWLAPQLEASFRSQGGIPNDTERGGDDGNRDIAHNGGANANRLAGVPAVEGRSGNNSGSNNNGSNSNSNNGSNGDSGRNNALASNRTTTVLVSAKVLPPCVALELEVLSEDGMRTLGSTPHAGRALEKFLNDRMRLLQHGQVVWMPLSAINECIPESSERTDLRVEPDRDVLLGANYPGCEWIPFCVTRIVAVVPRAEAPGDYETASVQVASIVDGATLVSWRLAPPERLNPSSLSFQEHHQQQHQHHQQQSQLQSQHPLSLSLPIPGAWSVRGEPGRPPLGLPATGGLSDSERIGVMNAGAPVNARGFISLWPASMTWEKLVRSPMETRERRHFSELGRLLSKTPAVVEALSTETTAGTLAGLYVTGHLGEGMSDVFRYSADLCCWVSQNMPSLTDSELVILLSRPGVAFFAVESSGAVFPLLRKTKRVRFSGRDEDDGKGYGQAGASVNAGNETRASTSANVSASTRTNDRVVGSPASSLVSTTTTNAGATPTFRATNGASAASVASAAAAAASAVSNAVTNAAIGTNGTPSITAANVITTPSHHKAAAVPSREVVSTTTVVSGIDNCTLSSQSRFLPNNNEVNLSGFAANRPLPSSLVVASIPTPMSAASSSSSSSSSILPTKTLPKSRLRSDLANFHAPPSTSTPTEFCSAAISKPPLPAPAPSPSLPLPLPKQRAEIVTPIPNANDAPTATSPQRPSSSGQRSRKHNLVPESGSRVGLGSVPGSALSSNPNANANANANASANTNTPVGAVFETSPFAATKPASKRVSFSHSSRLPLPPSLPASVHVPTPTLTPTTTPANEDSRRYPLRSTRSTR